MKTLSKILAIVLFLLTFFLYISGEGIDQWGFSAFLCIINTIGSKD